jgi:hypothetical protein
VNDRGKMERRLRERRREREALLLDLGALVYELHRQGKRSPQLLQRKAAQLSVVDQEVRELEARLEGREPPPAPEPMAVPLEPDEEVRAERLQPEEPEEDQLTDEYELAEEEEALTLAEEEEELTLAEEEQRALAEHEAAERGAELAEHEEHRA